MFAAAEKIIEFCRERMPVTRCRTSSKWFANLPKTHTQCNQYEALKESGTGNSWDRERDGLKVARFLGIGFEGKRQPDRSPQRDRLIHRSRPTHWHRIQFADVRSEF